MSTMWYGKLPERWETHRIKNLFQLRDERNFKPLSDVRLLSLYTAIGVKPHDEIERVAGNVAVTADNYKKVYKNDIVVNIILCWQGAIGLSKHDGVTSPAYDVYKAKSNNVNVDYFNYLFRTPFFYGECYKAGRGIMAMRWRTYSDEFTAITVPLPPRAEQDQIVRYLDWKVSRINKLINTKRRQIELLEEIKRAVINSIFTTKSNSWVNCRLKSLCRLKTGGTPKNNEGINTDGNGYNWVTPSDFGTSQMIATTQKSIAESIVLRDDVRLFPKDTILFIGIGGTLGKFAVLQCEGYSNQQITAIIPININSKFLFYALTDKSNYIKSTANYATLPIVNNVQLGKIKIPIPSQSEQLSTIAYLDKQCENIDKIVFKFNDEITLLAEYRTRLISDVVTGNLDVRGVVVPEYEAVEEAVDAMGDAAEETDGEENADE